MATKEQRIERIMGGGFTRREATALVEAEDVRNAAQAQAEAEPGREDSKMATTQDERVAIRKLAAQMMIQQGCRRPVAAYLAPAVHTYAAQHGRDWALGAVVAEVAKQEAQPNMAALKPAAFWA
jgi:hypothetical protein